MTREEFDRLVAERGGLAGPAVEVDPMIDNPNKAKPSDPDKIPNPNPKRKYIFNNGTELEARAATDAQGNPRVDENNQVVELQITEAGTALRPSAGTSQEEGVSAPTDQRYVISRKPDGSLNVQENPNYKGDKDEKSQLQVFGNQLLRINPDGTTSVLATKTAEAKEPSTVAFGDTLYSFDGQKITPLVSKPKEPEKPQTEVRNGVTYQWDPKTNTWSQAAGLPTEQKPTAPTDVFWTDIPDQPGKQQGNRMVNGQLQPIQDLTRDKEKKPATAATTTQAEYIVFYDEQGNEVSRQKNPNYVAPAQAPFTADTVSDFIPAIDPKTNQVIWTQNQNQVKASQAVSDLARSLGLNVAAGSMSEKQAQDLITGAVNGMNARSQALNAQTGALTGQAGAAQNMLQGIQQGAQTGAGLLNQRAQTAQAMLGNVMNMAGQGRPSGNLGGGMLSAPAGMGAALVGGIQNWATELGGGQDVYNSAASLVQRADPGNRLGADAGRAYGALGQALERFQQMTGQMHPLQQALAQEQQQPQQTGFPAPGPAPGAAPPATLQSQQAANRAAASAQTAAATQAAGSPFGGPIGANPMAAAMQQQQQAQAAAQTAAATQAAGSPFGGPIGNDPMAAAMRRMQQQQQGFTAPGAPTPTIVMNF
jgi:hypothetical protein